MKRVIDRGRIKFVLLKSRLRSYVYGAGVDKKMLMTPCECAFGHWLHEFKNQFGIAPEVWELDKIHMEVHTEAINLMNLYDEGKISEAQSGLEKINKLAERMEATMATLINQSVRKTF